MQGLSISKAHQIHRHQAPVAAGTTQVVPAAGVPIARGQTCLFVIQLGAMTASAKATFEIQASADSEASYLPLAGASFEVLAAAANSTVLIEVVHPLQGHLRCVVNRSTANSTIEGIQALVAHMSKPVTQPSSVAGDFQIISPEQEPAS